MSNAPEPPIPSFGAAADDAFDFPCGQCGARTTWDPEVDALACAFCGGTTPVPRAAGVIVEHPLEESGSSARGLGLETRTADCETCGARVAFGDVATVATCVFCGSSSVLARDANRNALRPESLIPLDISRAQVEQSFRRWLSRLWFRPNALKQLKRFKAVGVYVPYWTFDAHVSSHWSADSGTYYWTTERVRHNGRSTTRQVRKTRWRPARGQREDVHDDHLVNASSGIPDDLARKLGAFDTAQLVPYRPEYLAGFHAEEYRLDLEQGWARAREQLGSEQLARCATDIPGDTYRHLRADHEFDQVHWKHVLLPFWSLTYQHGKRTYVVLIHGQTGQVHGRAPWSWVKLLIVLPLGIALALALGAALLSLTSI